MRGRIKTGYTMSIDPGKHGSGVAVFYRGELQQAFYANHANRQGYARWFEKSAFGIRNNMDAHSLKQLDEVIIEIPQIYQTGRQIGRQSDLIDLAIVVGAIAFSLNHCPHIRFVQPARWKGQVEKPVMIKRFFKKLSDHELSTIVFPKEARLKHNVWDAIGIGLEFWK